MSACLSGQGCQTVYGVRNGEDSNTTRSVESRQIFLQARRNRIARPLALK